MSPLFVLLDANTIDPRLDSIVICIFMELPLDVKKRYGKDSWKEKDHTVHTIYITIALGISA